MNGNPIIDGVIIGAAGGFLAGVTVYVAQYIHEKVRESSEKKRVYAWLNLFLATNEEEYEYAKTRNIASHTNLTEDRVRYVCSIHKKIHLSVGEKPDLWRLKK